MRKNLSNGVEVLLVLLLVSLASFPMISSGQQDENKCLRDMVIISTTETAITVSWDYSCSDHRNVLFKVYYEHKRWMACDESMRDESRGQGIGNIETREKVAVLENLHPYSIYFLSMKAVAEDSSGTVISPPEEKTAVGETRASRAPGVAPEKSSIPTKIRANSLKFYWSDPPQSTCPKFGSELDGTYYILRGLDPWNEGEEQRGSTPERSKEFFNLKPFSTYALFLFVTNLKGNFNEDLFLKLEAKTDSDKPSSPRDLQESSSSLKGSRESRLLRWLPPYPPTGEISHYSLRWKSKNATVWEETVDVVPSNHLCQANDVTEEAPKYNIPICHTIRGLNPELTYLFQVAATNQDVSERSMWSSAYYSEGDEKGVFGLSKASVVIIVAVSLVSIILIILVATVVKFRCCSCCKSNYKNVPNYESSIGMMSMRTHSTRASLSLPKDPMLKYQHHLFLPDSGNGSRPGSIQEQPLPPVPRDDDHLYEELQLKPQNFDQEQTLESEDEASVDVLRPNSLTLKKQQSSGVSIDENDYLTPRQRKASSDTLDIEDYLKPTFNQFQHIDTRDMSPPFDAPPPIPKVSYTPVRRANQ